MQEVSRPHGQLAEGPRAVQPAAPPSIHPYDLAFDVREIRELGLPEATPTSANMLPAPVGADSSYVTAWLDGLVCLSLLVVFAMALFFELQQQQSQWAKAKKT